MIFIEGADRCSACGHHFDAETAVVGDNAPPEKGDYSVCLYCAHITRFDDAGADCSSRP